MVEQAAVNRLVAGSIPAVAAAFLALRDVVTIERLSDPIEMERRQLEINIGECVYIIDVLPYKDWKHNRYMPLSYK